MRITFGSILEKAKGDQKAGHKYKSRKPDGKGSWLYDYGKGYQKPKKGEHDHSSGKTAGGLQVGEKPARPLRGSFALGYLNQLEKKHGDGTAANIDAQIEAVKDGWISGAAIIGSGFKNPKKSALAYLADKKSKLGEKSPVVSFNSEERAAYKGYTERYQSRFPSKKEATAQAERWAAKDGGRYAVVRETTSIGNPPTKSTVYHIMQYKDPSTTKKESAPQKESAPKKEAAPQKESAPNKLSAEVAEYSKKRFGFDASDDVSLDGEKSAKDAVISHAMETGMIPLDGWTSAEGDLFVDKQLQAFAESKKLSDPAEIQAAMEEVGFHHDVTDAYLSGGFVDDISEGDIDDMDDDEYASFSAGIESSLGYSLERLYPEEKKSQGSEKASAFRFLENTQVERYKDGVKDRAGDFFKQGEGIRGTLEKEVDGNLHIKTSKGELYVVPKKAIKDTAEKAEAKKETTAEKKEVRRRAKKKKSKAELLQEYQQAVEKSDMTGEEKKKAIERSKKANFDPEAALGAMREDEEDEVTKSMNWSDIIRKAKGDQKASHKYKSRKPDGKGGWLYDYGKGYQKPKKGEHDHSSGKTHRAKVEETEGLSEGVRERIEKYNLDVIMDAGSTPEKAVEIAKKLEAGIDKAADICKSEPPICAGNMGIPRSDMPQIMDEPIKNLLASKDAGERIKGEAAVAAGADGDSDKSPFELMLDHFKDSGVSISKPTPTPVGQLKATQKDIQDAKATFFAETQMKGAWPNGAKADLSEKPIVISNDGHILDGHHRWAALLMLGPDMTMNAIKVDLPMHELLEKSFDTPGAGVFRMDMQNKVIEGEKPNYQEYKRKADANMAAAEKAAKIKKGFITYRELLGSA